MSRSPSRIVLGLTALGWILFGVGCAPKASESKAAFSVTVEVDSAVKATCVRVVAISESGHEFSTDGAPRKDVLRAAIYSSSELSGAVTLLARGFVGSGCDLPQALNEESEPVKETFTENEVKPVTLKLVSLLPAFDFDRDGFRSADKGGPDCADTSPLVAPGAAEACGDGIDNDCNGLSDCAEPSCVGSACTDSNACTLNDRCQTDGGCEGTVKSCNSPPDGGCFGLGLCDPQTGACQYPKANPGDPCTDGNPCTGPDLCFADGGCFGPILACNTPPGACFLPAGTCSAGACVYATRDAGASCNDSNPCTLTDVCLADGGCTGSPKSCGSPPSPVACYFAPGTCNPQDGGCDYVVNSGATCSDGVACTFQDTCQGSGSCSGTPFTCAAAPNECFVATGACLTDGGCAYSVDAGALYKLCGGGTGVCMPDGGCAAPSFAYSPSNFNPTTDILLSEISPPINLTGCSPTFNSTTGQFTSWCGGPTPTVKTLSQAGGPSLAVIPTFGLLIPSNSNWTLTGDKAVVLAVYGDATVLGQVMARASGTTPGPGGSHVSCATRFGEDGGIPGGTYGAGGGGGGFATSGGNGIQGNNSATVGGLGGVDAGAVGLSPLLAGCAGGSGGATASPIPNGGGGGGGLQLSVAGTLTVGAASGASAYLSVSGGGGSSSTGPTTRGGGGGGAGGTLVLEADHLAANATSVLTANGGGGGCGSRSNTTVCQAGNDGSYVSSTVAAGGSNCTPSGAGGAGTTPPTSATLSGTNRGGGGGGGAAGRIYLKGNASCTNTAGVISPPAIKYGCP